MYALAGIIQDWGSMYMQGRGGGGGGGGKGVASLAPKVLPAWMHMYGDLVLFMETEPLLNRFGGGAHSESQESILPVSKYCCLPSPVSTTSIVECCVYPVRHLL